MKAKKFPILGPYMDTLYMIGLYRAMDRDNKTDRKGLDYPDMGGKL